MTVEAGAPLGPEETTQLTEFARACKAAARAVALYPGSHPAIGATLGRIVSVTSAASLPSGLRLAVLPDGLLLDGRAPARADPAIAELAILLHSHLIIELVVHPDGDADAWRRFLTLLGRSPESLRAEGGIARVWATMVGRHVALREIDYAEVLREQAGGDAAVWENILSACLQGHIVDRDASVRELLSIVGNVERLGALAATLEVRANAAGGGLAAKTTAILHMLRSIVEAVSASDPEGLEPALRNLAAALGQLSPDTVVGLMSAPRDDDRSPRLMDALVRRMTGRTISRFVARNIITERSATHRLAQAFQALVRDDEERQRLLTLVREDLAAAPHGQTEGLEDAWADVAHTLLTSYSDQPYVSDAYGGELSGARARAIDVEGAGGDPPERIGAWLSTVATSALRTLDLALLLDLLRLESDDTRWGELMPPVGALVDDLLLVGDFDAANQLLAVVVRATGPDAPAERRRHATTAIDVLISGPMLRHIVTHLATIDDGQLQSVKTTCISLGEVLVRPLAEALSVEERGRTRERLTEILVAFGNVGRRAVERLKSSPNPAVRRTAIYLMREFGGTEALPDLTELLDDNEPRVQREAVRAILDIGTDAAYRVLGQALGSGTARTRDAIMQSLTGMRDGRAAPLFAYILRHVDRRGPLHRVYLRALDGLGALGQPEGIGPLKEALYQGEWWAPRRTRELRAVAAAALARIGTAEAYAVLDDAAAAPSRGVRSAARAQLKIDRGRTPRTGAA